MRPPRSRARPAAHLLVLISGHCDELGLWEAVAGNHALGTPNPHYVDPRLILVQGVQHDLGKHTQDLQITKHPLARLWRRKTHPRRRKHRSSQESVFTVEVSGFPSGAASHDWFKKRNVTGCTPLKAMNAHREIL